MQLLQEQSNAAIGASMKRFRLRLWQLRLAELNQKLKQEDLTITEYMSLNRQRAELNLKLTILRNEQ